LVEVVAALLPLTADDGSTTLLLDKAAARWSGCGAAAAEGIDSSARARARAGREIRAAGGAIPGTAGAAGE
jgi:hypothetical protein